MKNKRFSTPASVHVTIGVGCGMVSTILSPSLPLGIGAGLGICAIIYSLIIFGEAAVNAILNKE
jgi:hypothetical protein